MRPERSVPQRAEALEGDGPGLAFTGVAIPVARQRLRGGLTDQHDPSGESGGTEQADEESANTRLHGARGRFATRARASTVPPPKLLVRHEIARLSKMYARLAKS